MTDVYIPRPVPVLKAPQARQTSPILAALHDTDYAGQAERALAEITALVPPDVFGYWLARLPGKPLYERPIGSIARVLERAVPLARAYAAETAEETT